MPSHAAVRVSVVHTLAMAIEPLTHVQLFKNRTVWGGSVSSPGGMVLVGISDRAQGDRELASEELRTHLRDEWDIDRDLGWAETVLGVWTAEL